MEDLSPDQVLIDPGPEDILALDEIWSLVDSKANTAWLGFAIGRRSQQLVGWHLGTRDQVSANYFLLEAISKRKQGERTLARSEFLFPNQQPVVESLATMSKQAQPSIDAC